MRSDDMVNSSRPLRAPAEWAAAFATSCLVTTFGLITVLAPHAKTAKLFITGRPSPQ
jgi:hypothetical protein